MVCYSTSNMYPPCIIVLWMFVQMSAKWVHFSVVLPPRPPPEDDDGPDEIYEDTLIMSE